MDIENQSILQTKPDKTHTPQLVSGDVKQLLAKRYLLYKSRGNWTVNQEERAKLLPKLYPDIKTASSQQLLSIYDTNN
jgi:hypothetical protein